MMLLRVLAACAIGRAVAFNVKCRPANKYIYLSCPEIKLEGQIVIAISMLHYSLCAEYIKRGGHYSVEQQNNVIILNYVVFECGRPTAFLGPFFRFFRVAIA